MRQKEPEHEPDITTTSEGFHQTYNDCPRCGHCWETIPSIPGIIHRTRLCDRCIEASGGNLETSTN